MAVNTLSVEGETRLPYDNSYIEFIEGISGILDYAFPENHRLVDAGHGGGVEFYAEWEIDADHAAVSDFVIQLVKVTNNHGFRNLIIHDGTCNHEDLGGE